MFVLDGGRNLEDLEKSYLLSTKNCISNNVDFKILHQMNPEPQKVKHWFI